MTLETTELYMAPRMKFPVNLFMNNFLLHVDILCMAKLWSLIHFKSKRVKHTNYFTCFLTELKIKCLDSLLLITNYHN